MRFFALTTLFALATSYGVQALVPKAPAPEVSIAPSSGGVCLAAGKSCIDTQIRCCSPWVCNSEVGASGTCGLPTIIGV